MLALINMTALWVILLFCVFAVFNKSYSDNMLERIGLSIIACCAAARLLSGHGSIVDLQTVALEAGMALKFGGTIKRWISGDPCAMHVRLAKSGSLPCQKCQAVFHRCPLYREKPASESGDHPLFRLTRDS